MQIITPAQCRAARALLNWSQPELAERCDIHVQTISNFEKESFTPSKTTLGKIISVLGVAGIEVTEDDGVKRRSQPIQQFAKTHKFLFNLVWDHYSIIPDVPDHKPQAT